MEPLAYYNENDPFAAATLRELIADGLIAPGYVDERSIADVRADDLAGYRQHHFFAGFGVWSAALRLAGWPDDAPVWTASCPCPPFSSAGPNFRCPLCDTRSPVPNAVRTGAFDCIRCGHEWQADGRHLFPELFRLAREYRPREILGEQVASADGRTWLDIVSASLEMLGYAVGATDTCAAGFGAPHIRQREYWLADADFAGLSLGSPHTNERGTVWHEGDAAAANGVFGGLGNAELPAPERQQRDRGQGVREQEAAGFARGCLADGLEPSGASAGMLCGLAHPLRNGAEHASGRGLDAQAEADGSDGGVPGQRLRVGVEGASLRPGPTNGLWRDADWLACTDGKWRPVEPGTFPLADAGTFRNRVAELRGAGNAVNLAQAAGFIKAVMAHRALPASEAA